MPESAIPHAEPEGRSDSLAYYTRVIEELFSEKEDFISVLPSKTSLSLGKACLNVNGTSPSKTIFHHGLEDGLSICKKERLKTSLKQSVTDINQEVDQALHSVKQFRMVKYLLNRDHVASNPGSADSGSNQHNNTKHTFSSSPSSIGVASHTGTLGSHSREGTSGSDDIDSKSNNVVQSGESQCRGLQKICVECKTTSTPQWRSGPDGRKNLCNACGIRLKKRRMSLLGINQEEKLRQELDEDMRIVVDIGGSPAKDVVKQYSDEFLAKLENMEKQVENYMNVITSRCRNMTTEEKVQLWKLIQNLPSQNLDRVAEIIVQHRKLPEGDPISEIHIDLENEDNVTLWRLYYYVSAFENARRSCSG